MSSAVGDAVTVWVTPFLEEKLNSGEKFSDFVNMSLGPLFCGTTAAVSAKFVLTPGSAQPLQEFLLATGSKLAGDR